MNANRAPDAPAPGPLDFNAWDARQRYYITRGLYDGTGPEYCAAYMGTLCDQMFEASRLDEPAERLVKLYPLVEKALAQSVWPEAAGQWQIAFCMDRLTGAMTRTGSHAAAADLIGRYFDLPQAYKTRSNASTEAILAKRAASCRKRLG